MKLGDLGRLDDVLERGVGRAVGDVVLDGGAEQEDVLLDNAHVSPQGSQGEIPDVPVVDRNLSRGDVVEAGQEINNGALAAPGSA